MLIELIRRSMHLNISSWQRNITLVKVIFWREFNSMYRRTCLGPLWAFVAPAAYLCVFVFFRLMFGLSNPEGVPMIPFLFSGLSIWLLFAGILNSAFPAVVANVSILKKMPVPPLVFVLASSLLPLFTCCVYLVLLEGMLIYYNYIPGLLHLFIPVIFLLVFFFALGLGLLVASIAFYRQDIIQVLPTLVQLGMFATPIFYSPAIIPKSLQWAVQINPVAECVGMFRQILFLGTFPDWTVLLKVLLIILLLWAIALPLFKRITRYVADIY